MSRARHEIQNRAKGGRTEMRVSGNPDVFKEAEDKHGTLKKHGGKVKHRARGGGLAATKTSPGKEIGLMTGGAVRPRLDRPGRKRGGGVGADTSPLTSAHKGHNDGNATPHSDDTYGGTPDPHVPGAKAKNQLFANGPGSRRSAPGHPPGKVFG